VLLESGKQEDGKKIILGFPFNPPSLINRVLDGEDVRCCSEIAAYV
jgi:hypothetical protein